MDAGAHAVVEAAVHVKRGAGTQVSAVDVLVTRLRDVSAEVRAITAR